MAAERITIPARRCGVKPITIVYTIATRNTPHWSFRMELDPLAMEMPRPDMANPPEWTLLTFRQCPHCPLHSEDHEYCPLAIRIAPVVERFKDVRSFEETELEVWTEERTTVKTTTTQKALSSLMGLVIAVSGCPLTRFLRPMARFHLPLATEEETVCRAVSLYLLGCYFRERRGQPVTFSLDPLIRQYTRLETLNLAMTERIRAGVTGDAPVNALVILDSFAKALPLAAEDSLERIEFLFHDVA